MNCFSVERDGDVALVTLLSPSMGLEFFRELPTVFRELDADAGVRVIVLGGGANFSYGLDLKDVAPLFAPLAGDNVGASARAKVLAQVREWQASMTAVADCRTPIISCVDGWCIGGGIDLVAATDIRVATSSAKFSVRETKVAIVADLGGLQRLVGIIGDGHLRELALTGGDIDSTRAERIGLVNTVYPDAEALRDAAIALAREIAANSPLVVRGIKEVLDAERSPRVEAGLRYVATWNAAFLPSRDLGEAFASFAERRPAEYTGE
ncbi:MAG TPA: crotonase/enoyl-CoA hydratase family protein [Galbitalea sp.]|jgi:enoyl-CoA hydratase|nr:crotonase/enoyl-CoA hydratase family protein [Galbitalea sp.]